MTDLTEKWRKDELPEGLYYVENNEGNIGILGWSKFAGWYNIKQVLAPVPSYDEWKALKASYEMLNDANLKQATWMADMEKHNAKLEELLKECFEYIDWTDGTGSPISQQKLLDKIDEVLK